MAGRTVTINLGGKERRLKFDLNAVAEIGERLNINVRMESLWKDITSASLPLSSLRVLLWAGLRHEDTEITPEEVGSWVDQDNIKEVWERFFTLFGDKFSGKVGEALKTAQENSTTPDSTTLSESPTEPSESSPNSSGG